METVEEFIDEETFATFVETMPQVCVEIVVVHDGGVLLAKRANRPVQGEWFWPGSRLYKGEELETAARRIGREELGIDVTVEECLGVQSHYWETSAPDAEISRHTVNVVFRVRPTETDPAIELDDQHTDFEFVAEPRDDHHEMVQRYFGQYDLP